jgi:hypothetical protein
MQLWYTDTNSPVQLGDVVHLFKDRTPSVVIYVPQSNTDPKSLEVMVMNEKRTFYRINPNWIRAYWKGDQTDAEIAWAEVLAEAEYNS